MGRAVETEGFYQRYGKRAIDIALSSIGLVAISPLLGATALAIKLDSPGPVLFKQKRVGKGKELFEIYKFRSMRSDTPADVPTHQLGDPSARITKVGSFIRRTSIDELPQLVNILKGDMSFVGPRPALWNQYDLIEERDRYGANDVVPGLTGWARINGRDELEIPVKARYDGEYAADPSFAMDAKCFLGTIGSVLTSDGVVEGGTGQMAEEEQTLTEEQQDALVPPEKLEREVQIGAAVTGAATAVGVAGVAALARYMTRGEKKHGTSKAHKSLVLPIATSAVVAGLGACAAYDQMKKRKLEATAQTSVEQTERVEKPEESNEPVDPEASVTHDLPIRVLITGANSYVGTHVEQWLAQWPDRFEVDTIDMQDPSWREYDFSGYDTVYHVAGIAHADVGSVTDEQKAAYYAVNTDLAIECAQKAKAEGVSQFILMSSMIVYGGKDWIDASTEPAPANFYGDSKWRADEGVRALADERFKVAVLRPPMIYGRGSKGNYPQLAKLATKLPAFPQVRNRRSMLHIDNLCEFVRLIIEDRVEGIFFPQNAELVCTSDMVREIAKARGHRIVMVPGMSLPADLMGKIPGKVGGLASKAFGDSACDLALSDYPRNYRVRTFEESIRLTEGESSGRKQRVLFLVNHDVGIYNFRKELVERLLQDDFEVIICSPYGERIELLKQMGCRYIEVRMDRHGTNPIDDFKLIKFYKRIIDKEKPAVVFSYTIKPNIYGAIAAAECKIPVVCNITGLGSAVEKPGPLQSFTVSLYKVAFRKVQRVFVQNEENRQFFLEHGIATDKLALLPGSGVNLDQFRVLPYPSDETVEFVFISRIMREKGIDLYLQMAEQIRAKYVQTRFHICGFCEEEYEDKLKDYQDRGIVEYHGMVMDVRDILSKTHCTVHPTYYPEGMSNVLLESCACGRPIITTDRSGCREIVDDGINGYMIPEHDERALTEAVERFLSLTNLERERMGLSGRRKMEAEFDRNRVVEAYMNELQVALSRKSSDV